MKINFSQILKNHKGTNIKNELGEEVKLSAPCVNALNLLFEDEKGLSGDDKFKRYKLSLKIDSDDEVDVTAEDIALIKKVVGKGYPPNIVGIVYDTLEGAKG